MGVADRAAGTPGALLVALGFVLLERERADEAFDYFRRALDEEREETPAALAGMVRAVAAGERRVEALRLCVEAAISGREPHAAFAAAAHDLLSRSLAKADGEWLEHILASTAPEPEPERDPTLTFLLARLSLYLGRAQVAIPLFERVALAWPEDARVLEGLGEAQREVGLVEPAVESLRRALDLARSGEHGGRTPMIVTKLGHALAVAGRYEEGLEHLRGDLPAGSPYGYERILARSQCELAVGEHEAALASAEQAEGLRPTAVHPQIVKAEVLLARRETDAALAAAERALAVDPSSEEALIAKAQALLEGPIDRARGRRLLGRLHGAVSGFPPPIIAAAFSGRSEDAAAWYSRAEIAFAIGELAQAGDAVEEALQRAVGEAPLLVAAIQCLRAELQDALGEPEEAGLALSAAGDAFLDAGMNERAVELLDEARERVPKDQATLWRLQHALSLCATNAPNADEQLALLERSFEVFDEAREMGAPSEDFIWVHVTRAWTLLVMVQHELHRSDDLQWEALVGLERSLLVRPWVAATWVLVGRLHAALGNPATALQAIEWALEIDPDDPDAWAERATVLKANYHSNALGAVRDARARLDAEGTWLIFDEADLMAAEGRYAEAIELLETIAEQPAEAVMASIGVGQLLRLSGRLDEARERYTRAREQLPEQVQMAEDPRRLLAAWVAYQLDDVEAAEPVFREARNLGRIAEFDAAVNLAYCAILKGDVGAADELFASGLDGQPTRSQLRETLLDLDELAVRLGEGVAEREAVDRYRALVRACQEELGPLQLGTVAMRDELTASLDEPAAAPGSDRWLAAKAALARAAFTSEEMDDAVELYEELVAHDRPEPDTALPESRTRLVESLRAASLQARQRRELATVEALQARLVELGETARSDARIEISHALVAAGEPERAIAELNAAAETTDDPAARARVLGGLVQVLAGAARMAEAYETARQGQAMSAEAGLVAEEAAFEGLLGLCMPDALDLAGTLEHLRRSLDVARRDDGVHPLDPLVNVIESDPPLITSADRFNTVAEALTVVSAEIDEPVLLPTLKGLRLSLSRMAYRSLRHSRSYEPEGEDLVPVPTPIVFEGHPGHFPQDAETPEVQRLIDVDIPAMREAIFVDTGVVVPGVRIRVAPELHEGGFRVAIHGLEAMLGTARVGHVFVPGPATTGLWAGPRDPRTGQPGAWIAAGDAPRQELPPLDPLGFILLHVEIAVRSRLETFVGVPELRMLVERNVVLDAPGGFDGVLDDAARRSRLVKLAHALLREDVPIREVASLLREVADADPQDSFGELERRARLSLAHELPGVRDVRERVQADPEVQARLVQRLGDKDVVAMPRAETLELRAALKAAVPGAPAATVLVVEPPQIRSALWWLASAALPGIAVVTAEELEAGARE